RFKLWISIYKPDLGAIAQSEIYQRIRNVTEFARVIAADRTIGDHARVQVSAICALHSLCLEIARDEQCLHFLALQRINHMAQAQRATTVALRLADDLAQKLLLFLNAMFLQNARRALT